MKKLFSFFFISYFLFISTISGYSSKIIASGKNIGINLNSDYVIVIGSYDVDNFNILNNSPLQLGDKIKSINGTLTKTIYDMQNILDNLNDGNVDITYIRNGKEYSVKVNLPYTNSGYKTGLYVKDNVKGVGTLTFIDPETKLFGALGHEILEKTTKSKFDITDGTIYYSAVTGITKSHDGNPGEKNARSNSLDTYGKVYENTSYGIFGTYTHDIDNNKLYKVALPENIHLGDAKILTVTSGDEPHEYDIKILRINENNDTKNILFEITDSRLLDKTGGIVQGMSGSPIIQGEYIIGAVNYVLVDDTEKGYGIFITNMLNEAEN